MRFVGQVFRVGKSWAIEIPILDIATQGRTKKEAYEMIAMSCPIVLSTSINKQASRSTRREGTKVFERPIKPPSRLQFQPGDEKKAGLSLEEVAAQAWLEDQSGMPVEQGVLGLSRAEQDPKSS